MKNSIKYLVAFAAVAVACGCSNEMEPVVDSSDVRNITVVASNGELTRTSITEADGVYSVNWDADDKIVLMEQTASLAKATSTNIAINGKVASFTVPATDVVADEYKYLAVYPSTAVDESTASLSALTLNIPSEQNPGATSFDDRADLMVSATETLSEKPEGTLSLSFARISAIGHIFVKNLSLTEGEKVQSFEFSSSESALSGKFSFDASALTTAGANIEINNLQTAKSVKVNLAEPVAASDFETYFLALPNSLPAGSTYTVTLTTNKAKYSKTNTLTADLKLGAGKVSKFTFNMAQGEAMENLADIDPKAEYIITCGDYVLQNTANKRNPNAITLATAGISIENGLITSAVPTDYRWKITGNSDGTYKISHDAAGKTYYLLMAPTAQGVSVSSKTDGEYDDVATGTNYDGKWREDWYFTSVEGGFYLSVFENGLPNPTDESTRYLYVRENKTDGNQWRAYTATALKIYRVNQGTYETETSATITKITEVANVETGRYIIGGYKANILYILKNDTSGSKPAANQVEEDNIKKLAIDNTAIWNITVTENIGNGKISTIEADNSHKLFGLDDTGGGFYVAETDPSDDNKEYSALWEIYDYTDTDSKVSLQLSSKADSDKSRFYGVNSNYWQGVFSYKSDFSLVLFKIN